MFVPQARYPLLPARNELRDLGAGRVKIEGENGTFTEQLECPSSHEDGSAKVVIWEVRDEN